MHFFLSAGTFSAVHDTEQGKADVTWRSFPAATAYIYRWVNEGWTKTATLRGERWKKLNDGW